jgi:hypothetical protein
VKNRNPFAVFFLALITLGIYSIYWEVKTKGEMVERGADIPTSWLIIIPIANIWWLWKYSMGVERVTDGKMQGVIAFILLFVLGSRGQAIIQDSFNKVEAVPSAGTPSVSPAVTPSQPTDTVSPTAPPSDPTNPIS